MASVRDVYLAFDFMAVTN